MMNETLKYVNNASSILPDLNALASAWSNQFDSPPELTLVFDVNENGLLTVNGKALMYAPAEQVDADSIYVDVEWVGFSVHNGCSYDFKIQWSADAGAHPHVSHLQCKVPMEHIA